VVLVQIPCPVVAAFAAENLAQTPVPSPLMWLKNKSAVHT
jgi:hypothetical protein